MVIKKKNAILNRQMETSNRQTYFDFLRGFAILLVIGIHTYSVRPFEGTSNIIQIGFREAINFAVPLFLAISGFFIGKKRLDSHGEYLTFLKKQVSRVYLPAVVWSIPIAFLWIYKGSGIIESIAKVLLCNSFAPYYFIVLIIQFYILHPIIKKLTTYPIVGWGIILIINTVFLFLYNYYFNLDGLPTVVCVGPFVYWIVFYYLGVYMSESQRDYRLFIPIVLILVGFVSQMIETRYLMSIGKTGVGIKISSWVYSAGVILLLFSKKVEDVIKNDNKFYHQIVKLGMLSFGIYLTHVYFLIVQGSFLGSKNWVISFVIVTVLTALFVSVLKKVMPSRSWRLLGLQ